MEALVLSLALMGAPACEGGSCQVAAIAPVRRTAEAVQNIQPARRVVRRTAGIVTERQPLRRLFRRIRSIRSCR